MHLPENHLSLSLFYSTPYIYYFVIAFHSSGGSDAPFFTMAYGKDRSESDF